MSKEGTYQYVDCGHLPRLGEAGRGLNTLATYAPACPGVPQVAEYNHYYPFGMQLEGLCYSSGADIANNHLYNGKELQNDYGLGWYDYGARFYDPIIGRWHSVDPLSSQRIEWSPYIFCRDNPILNVDQTGALDDNFSVDKERGIIKLEEKTNDKFDVLYTKNSWDSGNKDKSITIDKGILENKRRTMETYNDPWNSGKTYEIQTDRYVLKNDNKSTDLFEFLAKNTKVEWAVTRVGNKSGEEGINVLTTSHINWTVHTTVFTGWLMDLGWRIRGEDHNHPGDKAYPLGNPNPSGMRGDKGFAGSVLLENPKAILRIYTAGDEKYHPYTNK